MPTLLLSTQRLPAAEALTNAARRLGWSVAALDRSPEPRIVGDAVFYGGSDVADEVAARFHLALVEPPFDLLARTPYPLRLRAIDYSRYDELGLFASPAFVKPADVRRKAFDAGIYRDVRDARLEVPLDPHMPVLVAEPVEWLEEHRCFILDGRVVASSTYLRFGTPAWRPHNARKEPPVLPAGAREICRRLMAEPDLALPPAFVVDIGLIADRGWAVVEYNPAWCSSLLGCDPAGVLPVFARACQSARNLAPEDRQWLAGAPCEPPSLPRRPWRPTPAWTVGHAGAMT
ncbi:MAG: ATP-grasp domain-containing protein [Actinomycetota bacterium]